MNMSQRPNWVNKYQSGGGLVYRPFERGYTSSLLERESNPEIETSNYLESLSESNTPFPVEPVRIEYPLAAFSFFTLEPKLDNYVERTDFNGPGKVYKTSEKEQFKSDILGAYKKALIGRGFDETSAEAFAKRLVAQDALESRYGQSKLAANYNFGGIKDFRTASDSLKVSTKEHENGRYTTKVQPFRKFKNLDEYVNYKIDLLGNENYNVFAYTPEMLYRRLTSAKKKYATDPDYERKLNNIYNMLWGR